MTEPLDLDWCVAWTLYLCEEVLAAHKQGLVYGVLAPHLITFRVEESKSVSFRIGSSPVVLGERCSLVQTPVLLPPELETSAPGFPTDVFGVAALCYGVLSGELPSAHPLPPLGDTDEERHFLQPLTYVLHKAMSPYVEERYESIPAFSEALRQALRDVGIRQTGEEEGLDAVQMSGTWSAVGANETSPRKGRWFWAWTLLLGVMLGGAGLYAYLQWWVPAPVSSGRDASSAARARLPLPRGASSGERAGAVDAGTIPEEGRVAETAPGDNPNRSDAQRQAPLSRSTTCAKGWRFVRVFPSWSRTVVVELEEGKVERRASGFCLPPRSGRVLIEHKGFERCLFAPPDTIKPLLVRLQKVGGAELDPDYCVSFAK